MQISHGVLFIEWNYAHVFVLRSDDVDANADEENKDSSVKVQQATPLLQSNTGTFPTHNGS
jgi:hypothetical protein